MGENENGSQRPASDQRIIKEGGYQPTTDPGPVPTSLIKPSSSDSPPSQNQPNQSSKE